MSHPHIAVNTRLLLPGRTEGISRFAHEVLHYLAHAHPEVRFSFFFDRAYDPAFVFADNVKAYVLPPQARHPVLWYTWFHLSCRWMLARLKPQVFFSPEFYLCPGSRVPQVPVFHDIAYEHFPEDIGGWAARYCQHYSPLYAQRADHLLTVSEYSKQDLLAHYALAPEKIEVVYNGAHPGFGPVDPAEQARTRQKYTQGKPYFYFVGTLQPRKNIVNLLKAFDQFRARATEPVKLLIVGRKGWQYLDALQTYERMAYKSEVHFTGFVPDEELVKVCGSALGLCYVPYLEGFGIPILEAMQCDTPVICSNLSSMPEVAGQAALLVDPRQTEQIAGAMLQLQTDAALRTSLILKGREQRQRFSWKKTAEKVWSVLASYL